MDRRTFIRSAAGLFVAAAAAPIVEPVERVRRWWQVGRNAPVSERGLVMAFEPMSREQIAAMYVSHEQRTNAAPTGGAALRVTVREPWTPVSGTQAQMYLEHERRMRAIDEHVRRGELFGVDTDYQQWKAAQRVLTQHPHDSRLTPVSQTVILRASGGIGVSWTQDVMI